MRLQSRVFDANRVMPRTQRHCETEGEVVQNEPPFNGRLAALRTRVQEHRERPDHALGEMRHAVGGADETEHGVVARSRSSATSLADPGRGTLGPPTNVAHDSVKFPFAI